MKVKYSSGLFKDNKSRGDPIVKNPKIMITVCFSLFLINSLGVQAQEPSLTSDCLQKIKVRDEQFNETIMNEIIASMQLDIDENSYHKLIDRDLDAAHLIFGGKEKDSYYQSLKKQFIVASRGKPALFVKPLEAYLLYKQPNNKNVAVHLQLSNDNWMAVKTIKKKGAAIKFKLLKCEKVYLKKKREYYHQD